MTGCVPSTEVTEERRDEYLDNEGDAVPEETSSASRTCSGGAASGREGDRLTLKAFFPLRCLAEWRALAFHLAVALAHIFFFFLVPP